MGIRSKSFIAIVALSAGMAYAAETVVPVAEDASVNASNPDGQLGTITTRGGLLAGLDDIASNYSFFLKFNLPEISDPLTKATLRGYYNDDFGGPATFVGAFLVPDDSWTESTITYANRPATGDFAGGASTSELTVGSFFDIDVTPIAQAQLAGDRVLSLSLQTIDGRLGDLKFFASKEFDAGLAFTLSLDTTTTPPPTIPLPPAVFAGGVGLGLAWVARRHAMVGR